MKKVGPLRAIRMKCLDCSNNSPKEVARCEMMDCSLHQFRFGKNPRRAGIGNKNPKRPNEKNKS